MKVTIANSAGFCFGVKRAIEIAKEQGSHGSNIKVFGQLVHNPQVVDDLNLQGIEIIDRSIENVENLKDKNVVITAHGIPESTKTKIKQIANLTTDATCPLVYVVHKFAKDLQRDGYQVVEIGDPNHIEVIGATHDLDSPIIINSVEEVDTIKEKTNNKRIGIVVQTTKNPEKVDKIIERIKSEFKEVKYYDTICHPTKKRQSAAEQLAKTVDLMIIIGGKNSSNTIELQRLCNQFCPSYHIAYPNELRKDWFKNKMHCGVTAGASTPKGVIDDVVNLIDKEF